MNCCSRSDQFLAVTLGADNRTNGQGSEWDVRSEERVVDFYVGAPPECSAWDPLDPANLAVIAKGTNVTYFRGGDDSGRGDFCQSYTRRYGGTRSLLSDQTDGSMFRDYYCVNADMCRFFLGVGEPPTHSVSL